MDPTRCAHCGDVIGVYEPVVLVDEEGVALASSYAAEPALAAEQGSHYHHACYVAAVLVPPPVDP